MNTKILITKEQIQKRVQELADEINDLFKNEKELIAICVLKGSVMFFTDLVKKLNMQVKYEFIKLSSYAENEISSGKFFNSSINLPDLTGKNVLLVEDIVDTGNTLNYINKVLKEKYKMKNYKTISLLNKPSTRLPNLNIDADFYGFEIENKFVFGYGLDYKDLERNLENISYIDDKGTEEQ